MSINKKLVSAALTATTILWAVGAAALPVVNAQTTTSTADLTALIASLQQQIAALTAQLNAKTGTTTASTGSSYAFGTTDLTIGSRGAGVTVLQQFLIDQGDLTVVKAPTGYFGTATQAALAKFQTANGIKPASGYYGPITRAYLAKYQTSSSTGTSTGTGTGTGTGSTTGTTAPATGLQVSLASDNPVAGSLVAGSARIPVLAFNLTAGNSGAATVSQLSFQKTGIVSDSAISNAYLVQNGQVVAQYSSLSGGVLTFSGLNLSIPAGQTVEYTLAVGISSGVNNGNTVSFSLPAASNVTAFGSNNSAITATGNFPLNGTSFNVTTVSNPGVASLTITSSSIGTEVTAGTQGNVVGSWLFNVGTNPVYLQNLNFHVIGSANLANLQNVKVLVNGTQFGQTLNAVPANGMADFTGNLKMNTGNNNVQVVADVMGSPNMYFQFEVLNSYDVLANDSQYNVPVSVTNTGGVGTAVNIQYGQITLNLDSNTPTTNIAKGTSNTTLAKYDLYAGGEPVKVQWLDFNINFTGVSATTTLSNELQNISLTDDAGNQVGSTINNPPTSNNCTPATGSSVAGVNHGSSVTPGSDLYTDCFGTSASPINYIIPANTTRVLSLKADIQNTANFSTVQASLVSDSNNLQGQVSSKQSSTSGVNGNVLTLVSSSLTANTNSALGSQSVASGASNVKIGSYTLAASSVEGVNVNTISVELAPSSTVSGAYTVPFQNLKLYVNGSQFGTTQNLVSGNTTYSFSGSQVLVPQGGNVTVDVYADTTSNASGSYSPASELTGLTGSGQYSYSSVSLASNVNGQALTFNGTPALTVSLDNTSPAATLVAQGTSGNALAVFDVLETSNVTPVSVTSLNIVENSSQTSTPDFSNLDLVASVNGTSVDLGAPATYIPQTSGNGYIWEYNNITGLNIPAGGSAVLTLKGQAGTYSGGSMKDNSTASFAIATTTDSVNNTPALAVVAHATGGSSTAAAITLSSASGNTMTVVRSFATASAVADGATTGRAKGNPDDFGKVTFTANASGAGVLNQVKLTFGGSAQPTLSSSTIWLVDQSNKTYYPTSVSTNTATFNFGSGTAGYKLAANSSVTFTVDLNTASVAGSNGVSQTLYGNVQSASDVQYTTSQDGTGVTIGLPTTAVPALQINSVSYAQGS